MRLFSSVYYSRGAQLRLNQRLSWLFFWASFGSEKNVTKACWLTFLWVFLCVHLTEPSCVWMCFRVRKVRRVSSRRQPQGRPPWSLCWTAWESYGTSSSTTPSTTWTTSCTPCSSTVRLHPTPPRSLHLLAKQDLVRAWGDPYCCNHLPHSLSQAHPHNLHKITIRSHW